MDPKVGPEVQKDRALLLLFGLVVFLPLAWIFLSAHHGGESGRAREGVAASLISQLSQAAKAYELDYAVYPPGDGTGSKVLAEYLQRKGVKQMQYFEFDLAGPALSPAGDIRNPVNGEKIIYYRCPGLHNPKTFDLWCADSKGKADGIHNWE